MVDADVQVRGCIDRIAHALAQVQSTQSGEALAECGISIVNGLGALLRLARTHSPDNEAFHKPTVDLMKGIADLLKMAGVIEVVFAEDTFYLSDLRLNIPDSGTGPHKELGAALGKHDVGGFTLHAPLLDVQIRNLAVCLNSAPADQARRAALKAKLLEHGIHDVVLRGPMRFKLTGEDDNEASSDEDVVELNERTSQVIDICFDNLGSSRAPDVKRVRRIVADVVMNGCSEDSLHRDVSASAFAGHSLRVCHVALILGRAIGLENDALQDLGVAAMFHDVGYSMREGADLAAGNEGYAPPFERHAMAGVRVLLRQRGFSVGKLRRLLATFGHHHPWVEKGYRRPTLFARILRIAEDYDNLSRIRGGGHKPVRVLEYMKSNRNKLYDPVLVQQLINTLGQYPPGTVLVLKDKSVVRSVSTVRYPGTFDLPLVEVLLDENGEAPEEPTVLELSACAKVVKTTSAITRRE